MKKIILVAFFGFGSSINTAAVDDDKSRYQLVLENPIYAFFGTERRYILYKDDSLGWTNWLNPRMVVEFSGEYKEASDGARIFTVCAMRPGAEFKSQRHMQLIAGFMKCPVVTSDRIMNCYLLYSKDK